MSRLKPVGILLAFVLLAAACGGSPDAATDYAPATTASANSESGSSEDDRPCEGGAFPDDIEMREILCAVQWAQVDVLTAGGEFDPAWAGRTSQAVLTHGEDRAAAFAELEAVLAEMQAAAGE